LPFEQRSGTFSGLCDSFHPAGHIGVKDMGVAERAFDVAVVQGLLHEFEIAGLTQELRAKVVPVVMETEVLHTRPGAHPLPRRLRSCDS
jgi:hypothetical protein